MCQQFENAWLKHFDSKNKIIVLLTYFILEEQNNMTYHIFLE